MALGKRRLEVALRAVGLCPEQCLVTIILLLGTFGLGVFVKHAGFGNEEIVVIESLIVELTALIVCHGRV